LDRVSVSQRHKEQPICDIHNDPQRGITLVTATVPPPNYIPEGTLERGQEVVDLNAWIVEYSEEHNVENVDFYSLLGDPYSPTYINPALTQPGLGVPEHGGTRHYGRGSF